MVSVRAVFEQQRGEGSGRGSNRSAAIIVMPEELAEQSLTLDEYAQVTGTYLTAVKLNPPDRRSGDEEKTGCDARLFLNDLQSFYELSSLPLVFWGMFAGNYLGWQAKEKWSHEVSSLRIECGANYRGLSSQDFETFMLRAFASLMPAREAKQRYSSLTQTGTVKQYVRDMIVRMLEGAVFHPGGSVFDGYFDGLRASVVYAG